MSKHTPGPWFVTGQMTKYVEARISGGLIQEVAACGPTEADGGYGDQQRANANLIAAAPNLLEALEMLLYTRTQERGLQNAKPGESPLHDRCRAAIAKARGES